MITISRPYIEKNYDKVRLCSIVNYDGTDNVIWYEVHKKYGEFLCHERADAFVLAFLPYAMAFKHDIKVEGGISEKLHYQLTTHYIPSISKFSNYYSYIKIIADSLDSTDYSSDKKGVGTGFSAGVDSFYTVLKHLDDCKYPNYKITHLTFFKVGATGSFGGEKANQVFIERINQFKKYADIKGVEFVTVDSNVSEHAKMSYNYIHSFRSMSAVIALQKLFDKYYYSSSASINDFSFNVVDSANYDFFNLNNFAVEGMELYSVGLDNERLDKQRYIQDFEDTYTYLNVCNKEANNCSRCEKCIRTMAAFHCLGTLDRYSNVFDIKYYYNNYSKCMAMLIGHQFTGTAEGNLDAVLLKNMRQEGIKIPLSAYIRAIPNVIYGVSFRVARNIKPIRVLFHKRMSRKLGCNYND